MSNFTDQQYLKTEQYRDASNLNARVEIHRRFSTNTYGWFPWIFDTLEKLPNPARVLELGCGPAYQWKECADRIPTGWEITLSDFSEGMLTAARKNLAEASHEFSFHEIDAQAIPFEDETFDIVIANHMLYHIPNRPQAFAEIRRVLKPRGYLVAASNGDRHLTEINKWLKQLSPDTDFIPFRSLFTLDNGLEQLKPFFSEVEITRYEDNLRVTDIDLMMNYIHSTTKASEIPPTALSAVRHELENLLETKGEIFIRKDSGMFKAVK